MEISLEFDTEQSRVKAYRLRKALYGVKQFSSSWVDMFCNAIISISTKYVDYTLVIRCQRGKLTILIVYMTDIVMTGDDQSKKLLV